MSYKIKEAVFLEHPFLVTIFESELKKEEFLLAELDKLSNYQKSDLTCHNITALIV